MKNRMGKVAQGLAFMTMLATASCVNEAPEVSGPNNPVADAGGDSEATDSGTTADADSTDDVGDSGGAGETLNLSFFSEQSENQLYRWAPLTPVVTDDSGATVTCDEVEFSATAGEIEPTGDGSDLRVLSESATIAGLCTRGGESTALAAAVVETVPLPTALPDAWLMAHYQYDTGVAEGTWTDAIGGAEWSQGSDGVAPSLVEGDTSEFPTLSFPGNAALLLEGSVDFRTNNLTITWVGSYDMSRSKSTWFGTCSDGNQQVYNSNDKLTFESGDLGATVEAAQSGMSQSVPRTIRFTPDTGDSVEITGWVDGNLGRSDSMDGLMVALRDIGGRCTSPQGEWLLGTISEVMIHRGSLPDDQIEALHDYLSQKYP